MSEDTQTTSAFLFKKVKQQIQVASFFMTQEQYDEAMDKQPDMFCFVTEVKTPKDLADAVREDPLARWVLFKGQMVEVSVAIPVFVDGRNIEKCNEWL